MISTSKSNSNLKAQVHLDLIRLKPFSKCHQNHYCSLCIYWNLFCVISVNPIWLQTHCQECSATGMGQFPICKLKWDFLRTSVVACIINENIFSAPFGIFYMRTDILKKKFQEIFYTNPQWGTSHLQTPVSKWELP